MVNQEAPFLPPLRDDAVTQYMVWLGTGKRPPANQFLDFKTGVNMMKIVALSGMYGDAISNSNTRTKH